MHETAVHRRIAPSASIASAVAELFVDEFDHDMPMVSIPRPEIQLVVRFGPSAVGGLDVHAFGVRQRVHRKLIRAGQRAVTARLHLGASEAVLGVPAFAVAGRIATLEELWGGAAARRLCDRLSRARSSTDAAAIMDSAIAERLAISDGRARSSLALRAAERLATETVKDVAEELGVSERHFRRLFRDAVGVSPKVFARLSRFHRALRAARQARHTSWASIAVATGYYDQAHLIEEFRAITGVTPRVLLGELGAGSQPPSMSDASG